MDALPISSRVSGLQVPLSRIQSLARAVQQVLGDMEPGHDEEANREASLHISNFTDLIIDLAVQTSKEAEDIERSATRQERGR